MKKYAKGGEILAVLLALGISHDALPQTTNQTTLDPATLAQRTSTLTQVAAPVWSGNQIAINSARFQGCIQMAEMETRTQDSSFLATDKNSFVDKLIESATSAGIGGAGAMLGGGSFGQGALSGALGNNSCSGPMKEPPHFEKPLECKLYDPDFAKLGTMAKVYDMADKFADCKISSARKAGKIAGCYSDEFDDLKKAMQESKKDFDAYLKDNERYLTEIEKLSQREDKRATAMETKEQSLGQKLQEAKDVYAQLNTSAEGTVTGLVNNLKGHRQRLRKLQDKKLQKVAQRTRWCLANGGATNSILRKCKDGAGNLLAPNECLFSMYSDSVMVKVGKGDKNASTKIKAAMAGSEFRAMTDRALAYVEENYKLQTQLKGVLATGRSSVANPVADLARDYGNAGVQMVREISACYSEQEKQAEQEFNGNEGLGEDRAELEAEANKLSGDLGQVCTTLTNTLKDASGELSLDMSGSTDCNFTSTSSNSTASASGEETVQQVDLDRQLTKIKNMNMSLSRLIHTQESRVDVPDGQPVACKGLTGCMKQVTTLKNQYLQNVKDLETGTFKGEGCPNGCLGVKPATKRANMLVREQLNLAAELYGTRVKALEAQFGQMKKLLAQSEVKFPKDFTGREKKALDDVCRAGDQEVCALPSDFGGAMMDLAGAPKLEGADFDQVEQNADAKEKEFREKSKTYQENAVYLAKMEQKCTKDKEKADAMEGVEEAYSEFELALMGCKSLAQHNKPDDDDMVRSFDNVDTAGLNLYRMCKAMPTDDDDKEKDVCKKYELQATTGVQDCKALSKAYVKELEDAETARIYRNSLQQGVGGGTPPPPRRSGS